MIQSNLLSICFIRAVALALIASLHLTAMAQAPNKQPESQNQQTSSANRIATPIKTWPEPGSPMELPEKLGSDTNYPHSKTPRLSKESTMQLAQAGHHHHQHHHHQTIEDHSLPKSIVKTFHVKCSNGRRGMVRYDPRADRAKMCVSVQDCSGAQPCVNVRKQQAAQHVNVLGGGVGAY